MEKKVYDLKIDPELEKVAPPLSPNALNVLERAIIADGCLAPLIVWNGVIVDGHNRYRICHRNNIPFTYEEKEFESKSEAKLWIVTWQIGRRNISDFQCCEMVYKVQDEVKAEAERRMKAGKPMQNSAQGAVRDILAEMAGVSHFRWEQAKVIIEKGDEKDKEQLRTGNAKINGIYTKIKNAEQPKESKKPEKACEEEAPIKKETSLECVNGPEDTSEAQRYDLPAPIVHLEQPIEVPAMEEMKKPEPRAFQFVKEQIQFAMKNMLKEVQIGLSWLREEDKGKIKELIDLLNAGADCAEQSIKEAGK